VIVGGDTAGRIAVVTVNWNGWQRTLECLAALRTSVDADWHLIIVDNASTDGSRERLRDLGSDVTLIEAPTNGGWTGGNNIGADHALAGGFSHIFILNNDALVEARTLVTLRTMLDGMGQPAIIGPVHLRDDGSYDFLGIVEDRVSGMPRWLLPKQTDASSLADPLPVVAIKGAGLFTSAATLRSLGRFDDRFYLNWDEIDWCFTARENGVALYVTRQTHIVHGGSATIGGLDSPLHCYFMTRNALLFAEKHLTARQRLRHLRSLYWDARTLAHADGPTRAWMMTLLRSRRPVARAFKRALRDYALRRFGDCPPLIRQLNAQR
jgi:GT2 family glycosyltransferase